MRLSENGRYIVEADGSPFFWLADTAWNGVLRGDDDNWERYLQYRKKQKFTVIQFVATNWRGNVRDSFGEQAWSELNPIKINTIFFDRMEKRMAMINDYGLVAAPVVLWALEDSDPGCSLANDDAIELARYVVERYSKYKVVWLFGGDCDYKKRGIKLWRDRVTAVFGEAHDQLITLHPCGQTWVGEDFRGESCYDIIGYQSGHGDAVKDLQWLTNGPLATTWKNQPPLPAINMEPNYETAYGYGDGTLFTDYHVRRAAYWSLLVCPPAGVTYGHDAIWNWNFETGPSEGHGNWHNGAVPPWDTGLESPGIHSMTILREIFERLDWTTLTPAQSLLREQPGDDNAEAFVAVAESAAGEVVVYSPCGGVVHLNDENNGQLQLLDPRTGAWTPLDSHTNNIIEFPDTSDWLAVYRTPCR